MNPIFKVVRQGQMTTVPSRKNESGQVDRCDLVLKQLGGPHANEFLCTLWGKDAVCRFYPGELVVATLRFSVNEKNYQDISVSEIQKIKN